MKIEEGMRLAEVAWKTNGSAFDEPRVGSVFWLEQALAADRGARCQALAGTVHADVCIVGGGYTGLWTAIELTKQAPDASVVLVEAQECGFGASGRNGGWATSWYDELQELVERFGVDQALWLAEQSSFAIRRIGEFCAEHGIDCHFRQAGALLGATTPGQLAPLMEALGACYAYGRSNMLEKLTGKELQRRTGSPLPLAGVLQTDAAALQPALLARGLRRVALDRGVRIFEGTPMIGLKRTRPVVVATPAGRVEAGQVVLATNAWAARVRELRRAMLPVGSQIVLTEPIPERIERLGWTGGELFGDARLMVHYAQVTLEGRVAFGRGGGALGSFGRVLPRHFVDPGTVREVAEDFRRFFPELADVRLTHAWGGAVDRAPGHLPFLGTLGDHENIHYGVGYSGNGVAPSAFFGTILGRLALGIRDKFTTCAMVSGPPGYLPPEPLRTLGGAVVREAVRRVEEAEDNGLQLDRIASILRRAVGFTIPSYLEPRPTPPRRAISRMGSKSATN